MAPPFKEAEFDMMFGEGISKEGDVLDVATNFDIVQKSGSWYSYMGERIGQGRDKCKEFLKANPAIMEEIRGKIMAAVEEEKQAKIAAAAKRAEELSRAPSPDAVQPGASK